jgi:hypothetical protein
MQDLRVIGVENGALLVVSDDGDRYRIPIDEVLQSKLRQSTPDPGVGRKLSPKEIQAHIRSGMSAQDVSSVTGVPLEYIQKFEGPVLAEREFVIETALGVAVHASMDTGDVLHGATFGTAIRTRLQALGAINERWASWKDPGAGWVVKLSFTADQIDHDARWSFDPRKLSLSPLNGEATTLSQQGEAPTGLVPRLRAVSTAKQPDSTRFDSGAFDLGDVSPEPIAPPSRFAPEATNDHNQTADLLDALRRRRGEREAASFSDDEEAMAAHPSTGSIRLVDVPMPSFEETPEPAPEPAATKPQPSLPKARKGRTAMPSWDDIVFGARPDDDMA